MSWKMSSLARWIGDGRLSSTSAAVAGPTVPARDSAVPTFDEIYAEHFDYVWQTVRRLGARTDEIDDVVQEVFIAVHRLLPRYEPGNLRGWLYAIGVNVTLHQRRRANRFAASHESCGDLERVPDSHGKDPEASAETRESVRLFEHLLDGLDTEKRAVLILAAIEQKSLSEIAEILDINVNTAAWRLRIAREQIQEGLMRHRARDGWRMK